MCQAPTHQHTVRPSGPASAPYPPGPRAAPPRDPAPPKSFASVAKSVVFTEASKELRQAPTHLHTVVTSAFRATNLHQSGDAFAKALVDHLAASTRSSLRELTFPRPSSALSRQGVSATSASSLVSKPRQSAQRHHRSGHHRHRRIPRPRRTSRDYFSGHLCAPVPPSRWASLHPEHLDSSGARRAGPRHHLTEL